MHVDDCYTPTRRRISGLGLDGWLRQATGERMPSWSLRLFAAAPACLGWLAPANSRSTVAGTRVPEDDATTQLGSSASAGAPGRNLFERLR